MRRTTALLLPFLGALSLSLDAQPSSAQPSSAQPSSAQPPSAHPSSARPPSAEGVVTTTREAYDHRAPVDRSGEEALRWIPRVLLSPVRLVLSLGREVTRLVLEPIGPPPSSPDELEASPPPVLGLPTLTLETESSPAIGVQVRLLPSREVRVDAAFAHWDDARIEGSLRARYATQGATVRIEGGASTRGDRIFHGLGWASTNEARERYRHHRGDVLASIVVGGDTLAVDVGARLTHHRFAESGYGGAIEPSISAQSSSAPAAFASGATVLEPRVELELDSRRDTRAASRDRRGSGIALALTGAAGLDLESTSRWARAAARGAGTIVLAPEHDLTLGVWATALEPASAAPIPFVELAILGGEPGRLAGLPQGRLHGESAAVAHARYRWGIASEADAAIHVELGNVLGRGFEGFDVARMRASLGIAIDVLGTEEEGMGVLVAVASEPLADGAAPSGGHVRFFVGRPPR